MRRLADVAELVSGQHVLADRVNREGNGTPYLTGPSDFSGILPSTSSWTEYGTAFAEAGDILVTVKGSGCGTMALADRRYAISRQLMAVRAKQCDARFLWVALSREVAKLRAASAGTIPGLTRDQILGIEIPEVPGEREQRIGQLDERFASVFTQLEMLIEAKQALRRGLMRELLSSRRRFPGFEGSGEWQELALGKLLEPVERPVDWNDAAVYRLASIRRRNGGFFAREAKKGADIKTKSLFTVRAGDFVISRMQAVHGALAAVTPEFDGWQVSGMYMVLRPRHPERIRTAFLHYASHLRAMYSNVFLSCHGVHIEKMTFDPKKFLKMKIVVPPTLLEQDRVVEVLRKADREIALLEAMRIAIENQKRVLMVSLLDGDLAAHLRNGSPPELAHA